MRFYIDRASDYSGTFGDDPDADLPDAAFIIGKTVFDELVYAIDINSVYDLMALHKNIIIYGEPKSPRKGLPALPKIVLYDGYVE